MPSLGECVCWACWRGRLSLCQGFILPFDSHHLACVEVVQLSGMPSVDGPRFTGAKECCDDYNLVDLELGTKADAPTLPDVGSKSPKGVTGLGDSVLDFLVDGCLAGQGASQVSEFTLMLGVPGQGAWLLARVGLVHDFGFRSTDGEAEVVECPREPVNTSLHFLQTCGIESAVMLKSVGASTQSYFTPFVTGKTSDVSVSSCTQAITPSWKWCSMVINL